MKITKGLPCATPVPWESRFGPRRDPPGTGAADHGGELDVDRDYRERNLKRSLQTGVAKRRRRMVRRDPPPLAD